MAVSSLSPGSLGIEGLYPMNSIPLILRKELYLKVLTRVKYLNGLGRSWGVRSFFACVKIAINKRWKWPEKDDRIKLL